MALPPNNPNQAQAKTTPVGTVGTTPPNSPAQSGTREYTDSQLHDIFVSITSYLMDTGHITVGDSRFARNMSNFLTGQNPSQDNHNHGNQQKTHRYDPKAQHVDPGLLDDNLSHIHGLSKTVRDQIVRQARDSTIFQLLDKMKRLNIQIPANVYAEVAKAIMQSPA